jgi:hypothetical protein
MIATLTGLTAVFMLNSVMMVIGGWMSRAGEKR